MTSTDAIGVGMGRGDLVLNLVLQSDYLDWHRSMQRDEIFRDDSSPIHVHRISLEDSTNQSRLPRSIPFSFQPNTVFRVAKARMIDSIRPRLNNVPPTSWTDRLINLLCRDKYGEFEMSSPTVPDLYLHLGCTLANLGFVSGDLIVLDYAKSAPMTIVSLAEPSIREAMKKEKRRSVHLDDFVNSLISDERCSFPMDTWDTSKRPSPVRTIGVLVFYTEEDLQLATYVRQHYEALHAMSGYSITLYVFEDLPSSKTRRRIDIREFWRRVLPNGWFSIWSALGLTMSVPYPTASVYKIAASVALEPEILPCVLLFRDWKRIKSERVVIPISEPFPQFFRSLCTKVRRAVDAARCDTPEDLFIASSTSIDYLSPVKDSMPDAPKKAKSKPSDTVRPASVFLCHSTRDKKFVERLADDLRRFGLSVWLDKWEIKVGDSIVDRVESGVRDNDYLAVVLSPDSISSAWVSRELNAAYIRELEERRVIILPIVIRKCEIPLRIREKRYADFSVDYVSGLRELLERLEPGAAKNIEDLKFLLRNESHPQE